MSSTSSPNIVRDGLLFYIDPANPTCYRSGSTRMDCLINDNTGSFTSSKGVSPKYNSSFQGILIFNGTSTSSYTNSGSYIAFGSSSRFNIGSSSRPFSLFAWCRFTSESFYQPIISYVSGTTPTHGYEMAISREVAGSPKFKSVFRSASLTASLTGSAITTDMWAMVGCTWNGSNVINHYVNGVLDASISSSLGTLSCSANLNIGARISASNMYAFSGSIASVLMYTKSLSEAQVKQNYMALKYRFPSASITIPPITTHSVSIYAEIPVAPVEDLYSVYRVDGGAWQTPVLITGGCSIMHNFTVNYGSIVEVSIRTVSGLFGIEYNANSLFSCPANTGVYCEGGTTFTHTITNDDSIYTTAFLTGGGVYSVC